MKYKIGDVPNKTEGEVVGIYLGSLYYDTYIRGSSQDIIPHPWDGQFPGWRLKPVYLLKFIKPQRIVSFDEFKEQNNWIKDEYLEKKYDEHCPPKFPILAVPEDGFNTTKNK